MPKSTGMLERRLSSMAVRPAAWSKIRLLPHIAIRLVNRDAVRLLAATTVTLTAIAPIGSSLANDTYAVDPDTGYRMERYRAPVPDSVPGGTTIDTAELRQRQNDFLLIDVFPPKGLGADPLDGSWIISEGHDTIAGATWLPEVGRGYLTDEHTDYFWRNLERLTQGEPSTPLVFFCTADCWQSWNAARRASLMGYTAVHWYPLGTDGWLEEGGELVAARPVNFLDDTLPATDEEHAADAAVATVPNDHAASSDFPERARIALVDTGGEEVDIGSVTFETAADGSAAIAVNIGGDAFNEHFLNMFPFRCIDQAAEWFCYLPYPYALDNTVSADDLTDLEYQLLFIRKASSEFGIDTWNGVYYTLTRNDDGSFEGLLHDGDLNVLAGPPEDPDTRPIDLEEFIGDERALRRFPSLVIRP